MLISIFMTSPHLISTLVHGSSSFLYSCSQGSQILYKDKFPKKGALIHIFFLFLSETHLKLKVKSNPISMKDCCCFDKILIFRYGL